MNPVPKLEGTRLRRVGVFRLGLSVCLLATLWLVVFPLLAELPTISKHLRWLNDRKINPGAMYYTELEVVEPILDRLNRGQSYRSEKSISSNGQALQEHGPSIGR